MQGTVPYLGLFLTDLTMIDTAFRDFLRDGVINFDKKRREYEILAQIQMLQSMTGVYRIEPESVFFDWFYRLRVYDENERCEYCLRQEMWEGGSGVGWDLALSKNNGTRRKRIGELGQNGCEYVNVPQMGHWMKTMGEWGDNMSLRKGGQLKWFNWNSWAFD